MSLFRSYEPVLIVLLREHTFVQRRSPSKHEWIERFAMTETLRYSGDRSEEGETMTKLEALSDAFEKFKAEQSSVNSSLHSELISLQSQIEGLQRMTARIAASNYETLAIMILARTAENHTPSWPANLRKYYFSNQVRAGDPMIRAAMVLLDANVPEAQVAFELDKLLQGRNNDTHCILLEDIDNKVAEALTDLQNNPVAKATLAESNATLLAIFEEYDALKTFFRLN